jgi:transcriptional regulator with PAS, ATPase and Fis domain
VIATDPVFDMSSQGMNASGANQPAEIAGYAGAAAASRSPGDTMTELLRTISEVLDVRQVFSRVSEIAKRMLPHDHLHLLLIDPVTGQAISHAGSTDAFPQFDRVTLQRDDEVCIFGDLRKERLGAAGSDERRRHEDIVEAGYRSLLAVRRVSQSQTLRLEFLARRPHAFGCEHVPNARRIADYIAMAVSHQHLAETGRHAAVARLRADPLDTRVHSVTEGRLQKPRSRNDVIGQSAQWQEVLKKAARVATTEATTFLQGESGTGKEVVARFIHRTSPRRDGPFVAINCAALPEQLLESELFGYERGAFTGAQQSKPGQIELASGGVLFLDEVSEMSPGAQAKFLRVLQEREFCRLGGTRMIKANVRVIAATNRDLRQAMQSGAFREDLYYRLQVFDIAIPPLRERPVDIPSLAEAFVDEFRATLGRSVTGVTPEAMALLLAHRWPGNVRELRNAMERAAILCDGGCIAPEHLALQPDQAPPAVTSTDLRSAERLTIEQVLRETDWNKAKAARRLGLSRTQLYVRLRKYDLEPAVA